LGREESIKEGKMKKKKIDKIRSVEYDILYSEIMALNNRLNAIEAWHENARQITATYINPRIKVEGEQC